jgi:hypothetical protein
MTAPARNTRLAERHGEREGEIAAEDLGRRDPERGGEVDLRVHLDPGNDVAAEPGVASARELALIEVHRAVEENAGWRQEAGHRHAQPEDVEARAAFRPSRGHAAPRS